MRRSMRKRMSWYSTGSSESRTGWMFGGNVPFPWTTFHPAAVSCQRSESYEVAARCGCVVPTGEKARKSRRHLLAGTGAGRLLHKRSSDGSDRLLGSNQRGTCTRTAATVVEAEHRCHGRP